MTNKRTAPPYSEAEATAWLAWLAYNMRRRDMTIFQIESLQPDWLTGRKEKTTHLLLTRALWGVWAGLIFGLIFWSSDELIFGQIGVLIAEQIVGLIFGLIVGLIELVTPIHKLDTFLRTHANPTRSLIIGTLVVGLIGWLIFGLIVGRSGELNVRLIIGLFFGLFFGFVRTSRVSLREVSRSIHTVESLRWSWQHVRQNAGKGLIVGLIVGLVVGLIFALIVGLSGRLIASLIVGLIFGLIVGLIVGLTVGLIGGFQPGADELKTRPNQGIWLTIQSALKIGLSAGVLVGSLLWLLWENIATGLLYCIGISLIIGGWYGGLDAIEHGIIRLIITRRGHAPLNYARFLDYAATELNFLQKVGGGYIFIHRYLLEHFAEIAVKKGYVPFDPDGPSA